MIKTLADEFMDIMNNLDNGCPASRIEGLYNDIKNAESKVKTLNNIIIRMQLTLKESVREQFDELADKLMSAESKLVKAQELVEKWRSIEKTHNGVKCHAWKVCANELDEVLKGED